MVSHMTSMKLTVVSLVFFPADFFEHVLFVVSLGTSTLHLVIILVIVYISKKKCKPYLVVVS